MRNKGVHLGQITEAVVTLAGMGVLAPVQDADRIAKVRKYTDKLNAFFCDRARWSNDPSYLASPVIGGGIVVTRLQQHFLLAREQGQKQPAEWAQFAWNILRSQSQKLIKDGTTLQTDIENLTELNIMAKTFAEKQLPLLRILEIRLIIRNSRPKICEFQC